MNSERVKNKNNIIDQKNKNKNKWPEEEKKEENSYDLDK